MIITTNDYVFVNTEGKRIWLTSGVFDLVHYYHLRYLERCKSNCDFLIVGIDSDSLVQVNKNKTPVINEYHRLSMINALKCVDAVFIMDSLSDFKVFADWANVIFKNNPEIYGTELICKDKVMIIPDIKELSSTTEIIESIRG